MFPHNYSIISSHEPIELIPANADVIKNTQTS